MVGKKKRIWFRELSFKKGWISDWTLLVVLNANFFLSFFYVSYEGKMSGITVEEKCVQEKKSEGGIF